MVLTDEQKLQIINILKDEPEVVGAYLFGSQAKGQAGPMSDIDLGLILASNLSVKERDAIIKALFVKLSIALETNDVDILDLRTASVFLRYKAMFDGRLLFSKDQGLLNRLSFEAMQAYEDFRPHLAVQEKFIKQYFTV